MTFRHQKVIFLKKIEGNIQSAPIQKVQTMSFQGTTTKPLYGTALQNGRLFNMFNMTLSYCLNFKLEIRFLPKEQQSVISVMAVKPFK